MLYLLIIAGYKPIDELSSSPSSSPKGHARSKSVGSRVTHNVSSSSGISTPTTINTKGLLEPGRGEDEVSMESGGSDAGYNAPRTPQNISITSLLESVLCGLEEPRGEREITCTISYTTIRLCTIYMYVYSLVIKKNLSKVLG